jgi:hypothetical protein
MPSKSRTVANIGLVAVAAFIYFVSKRWESTLTVVLPGCVIHWIISRENRLARDGFQFPRVRWQTKLALFVLPLAFSMGLTAFWFPAYTHSMNPWGIYSIASFSMALLLVKLYEHFLSIRRKTAVAAEVD